MRRSEASRPRGRALAIILALLIVLWCGAMAIPAEGSAGPAPAASATPVAPARSGEVQIDVSVDRTSVTIGDPITVTIRLTHPANVRVTSFEPESALGDLALLDRRSEGPEKQPDGRVQDRRVLRLARYETGVSLIPSFEGAFVDGAGKPGRVASAPVSISVTTILGKDDARPADIKNPAVMAERVLWPWLAAAAVAAVVLVFWWMKRRRAVPAQQAPAPPTGPPRPAHETAYAELERLLSSGILEKGHVKQFYIELAEILRRYLTARFGVETFERTTSEVLEALRAVRLPVRALASTADFLGACDMVKFAKYVPPADETRVTVERAYRLIDETKAAESPAPAAAGAVGGGAR